MNNCPWVCSLNHFLKLSLFGVDLLLLSRKAWRILTSIWTLFQSLRIFLPIPKESGKISKTTWILVFIIVLKATCLIDLPLSLNNCFNFKKNIIDHDNRHMFLLQHTIQRPKYETFSFLIHHMAPLICFSFFMSSLFKGNNKLYLN